MTTVNFDAVANLGIGSGSVSGYLTLGSSATGLLVAVGGYLFGETFSQTTTVVNVTGSPNISLTYLGDVNTSSVVLGNSIQTGWVALYLLKNPPTEAQQINVTSVVGSTPVAINVTAISFTGVGQVGPAVTNFTNASTAAVSGNIVSATGNRVLTIVGDINSTLTLSGGGTQRSNQPSSANASYITLLIQDQAGAATVSNTATASNVFWGTISVNLIAGSSWSVGSTLALTTSTSQSASFVGRVWTVGSTLALTVARTAAGVDQPYGPPLRYVGRLPDTDATLVPASYAGSDYTNNLVTPTWLSQQITAASQFLVTPAWINSQINGTGATPTYLSEAAVTTALGNYISSTGTLGASNGIAQLNGSNQIPAGQLPTLTTNNLACAFDCINNGTIFLQNNTSFQVVTQSVGEFVLANIVVPSPEDGGPNYPYVPLPFAWVVGYSNGGTPSGTRLAGTGNFGALYVTIHGEQTPIYGMTICNDVGFRPNSGSAIPNYNLLVPGCLSVGNITPQTQLPIQPGETTLDLSGCNWTEADYLFEGSGLIYFVICMPGLI